MYVPANGQVITKPFQFWDPYHQKFIQVGYDIKHTQ